MDGEGKLNNSESFEWAKLRFARFLAVPFALRPNDCQTQQQFSELIRIPQVKLAEWKREEGFWDLVHKEAANLIGEELPEIFKAMVREAKIGSVPAAKLCLSILDLDKPIKVGFEEPLTIVLTGHAGEDAKDHTEP